MVFLALVSASAVAADRSVQSIDAFATLQAEARAAQRRIDAIHQRTERAREEARAIATAGSADALRVQEAELRIAGLERTLADYGDDLRAVAEMQTGIVALVEAMLGALSRFVALDLPFRRDARLQSLDDLRAALSGSETVFANYHAVVAAYQREIDYGSSTEVYTDTITTPRGPRVVTVLRHGRVGLWYLSPDGLQAGRYDQQARSWTEGGVDAAAVRNAVAVVAGRARPAPIALPVRLAPQ